MVAALVQLITKQGATSRVLPEKTGATVCLTDYISGDRLRARLDSAPKLFRAM